MKRKTQGIVIITVSLVVLVFASLFTYNIFLEKPSKTSSIEYQEETVVLQTDFLTYNSPAYGIRINYPNNWVKQEQLLGTVVSFLSPMESESDNFRENFNIMVEDLPEQMSLSVYSQAGIAQLKNIINDITLLSSTKTTLDGNKAQEIVFTGNQGIYNLKWNMVFTIKNNKAYVLSYIEETNNNNEFITDVKEMVNSFEVVN